jgi:predicted AAA+ superfamily ATPase
MKRLAYKELLDWKNSKQRKPLLVQGARQVGKTFLIQEFGKNEYKTLYYFNFEQDKTLSTLFDSTLDPEKIISNLSLYIGEKIESKHSLIFFDEIQIAPSVLTSLKYFQENTPEHHIIAAGSLLGVSLGKDSSFPVGKVNFLTLYPMSFSEYLMAAGEALFIQKFNSIKEIAPFPEAIHNKILDHLKLYLFLGGMPEVIKSYIEDRDIANARSIQNEILNAYDRDFSKYTEKNQAIKTSEFWNSIPGQLAKENKKFKYGDIKKNARSSMYEPTIEWLRKAGLILLAYNVESPKIPLSAYADFTKFKVFMHDVGLLAAKLKITSDQIVIPDAMFREFNGAFIENFIAQELISEGNNQLFYWTSRSDAEVDFLVDNNNKIYPLEVKSGTSRNTKSLQSYAAKYHPERIIRISPRNLIESGEFINIPLYAIGLLKRLI